MNTGFIGFFLRHIPFCSLLKNHYMRGRNSNKPSVISLIFLFYLFSTLQAHVQSFPLNLTTVLYVRKLVLACFNHEPNVWWGLCCTIRVKLGVDGPSSSSSSPWDDEDAGGCWCSVLCIPTVFPCILFYRISVLPVRLVFTAHLKGMVVNVYCKQHCTFVATCLVRFVPSLLPSFVQALSIIWWTAVLTNRLTLYFINMCSFSAKKKPT